MNKNGFIYSNMAKYRLKFTIIVIIVAIIFGFYTADSYKYISKKLFGAVPLDINEFNNVETTILEPDFVCDTEAEDAPIFGYALEESSYFQGNKYYFDVPVSNVTQKNIAYTVGGVAVTDEVDTQADPIGVKAEYITVGNITVPVLMGKDQEIKKGDTVKGIFTRTSTRILEEFAKKSDGKSQTICKYTLDIRGIEMEAEFSDCVIWTIYALILLFLIIKLIIYYIKPQSHPMISQLEKYGQTEFIIKDIEDELNDDSTIHEKNEITTKNWILQKKSFKYLIVKNHKATGSFKYTPDFK